MANQVKLDYSQKIAIEEGLSHNGITAIHEDSRGYLWFGTYDGLNRYDGYEIKTFKNDLKEDILLSSRIRCINEDSNGNLWIGTEEGITLFNFNQQQFSDLYSNILEGKGKVGPIVRKIIMDEENKVVICITDEEGILLFNFDYGFIGQYLPSKYIFQGNILIHDALKIYSSEYLLATNKGVLLFDVDSKEYRHILKKPFPVCHALTALNDTAVLAYANVGMSVIRLDSLKQKPRVGQRYFEKERIRAASIDSIGNIWLGTINNGVVRVKNIEGVLQGKEIQSSVFQIKNAKVRANTIIQTKQKGCWIGTQNEGVFRFDVNDNPFKSFDIGMKQENSIRSNMIAHIAPLDSARSYIVGSIGGVGLFNTESQMFEPLPFELSPQEKARVQVILLDSRGNTWLYIYRLGLCIVKKDEQTIEVLNQDDYPLLKNVYPRDLLEDKYGNIWLRNNNNVLKLAVNDSSRVTNVSSLADNLFFKNKSLENTKSMYLDPTYDFLWLGTKTDGLYRINCANDELLNKADVDNYQRDKTNHRSITSNFITSIIRLKNNELWVATERGGICQVKDSNWEPTFYSISEEDGLSNNVVRDLVADKNDNLWITTNAGLNVYESKSKILRKFGIRDGLPFHDFWFSSTSLNNGQVLLGGVNGLCYFNPEDIKYHDYFPTFAFDDFKVLNKSIAPGDSLNDRVLLKQHINKTQHISLEHDENVFSFELKSLHFGSPKNYYYRYKLVPFNKDWIINTTEHRHISYSGLPHGEYTLLVSVSNSIKNWTEAKALKITIETPFWKTGWAYVIYVLTVILVSFVVVYFIVRLQRLKYNLQIEKVEKDQAKNINAAKLRFFSDISHEIRTPITLISGPISQLLNRYKGNEELNEKLMLVKRQSQKISQLVDQVHDFQKADENLLKMEYSNFCFNDFVDHLLSDFRFLSKHENKLLEVHDSHEKIYVSADKDKLEKVLNNLLNNAFKYSKPNDKISLAYERKQGELIVKISDTGKGISAEDLPNIFNRFYQSKNREQVHVGGSGIGLAFSKRLVDMHYGFINAESTVNIGSTFTLRLPIVVDDVVTTQQTAEILSLEEQGVSADLNEDIHQNSDIVLDSSFSNIKVFLAEDNQDMREYITESLSEYFKVKAFSNGKECMNALESEWPDILISDVLMPEMNGLDLCKQVKTDIKTSHIPIILLTACIADNDRIKGLKVGADAYIKKPFDLQHLVTNMETLLKNRKQLRERFLSNLPLTLDSSQESSKDHAFIEKLYSLISENMDNQDLDIDSFAKELFLSRSLFFKKVKAVTNSTPYELLKDYRIKKAAEFLVQKKISVNEVFAMTGFKSRTHFTKLFKEKFGVTPGKYASETRRKLE
ncbi:hybrid sensor histidine kinase/response regulator transcription factor [Labilibacter marinus]|uniref:hybrid sensor histidine kinase/response regulator transcription factor n=1 Tax=Labilibacter marinus TaxID=1477105 RepID=UPI00083555C0|nr:hybrid sensor histidine kinase/response regulator transcription factor [Labilibacter marinus]